MAEQPVRVVCVGGGWTAIYLVKKLRRRIRRGEIDLVVVSRDTFHTMHGFMAEMLTGRIQPNQIMSPARRVFRPARFQHAEVTDFDLDRKVIVASRMLDGREIELPYDHLVVSVGTFDDLGRYAGAQEHALRLRSYTDALAARNHIIGMLEMADLERDEEERQRLLTFVVAGGGYGGVEVATELDDFCRTVARRSYPGIAPEDIRVVLAHSGPDILTELLPDHAPLQRYAQRYVDGTPLERRAHTRIAAATPEEAILDDGTRIPTRTIISCTGMGVPPLVGKLPVATDDRGRIVTDETLQVPGTDGVWAGGDNAAVPHPSGGACPALAIYAMRHGRMIGRNIGALVDGKEPAGFRFSSFGDACSLGRRRAVAQLFGLRFRGRPAWVLWRVIFLFYVPLWDRRLRLLLDWTLQPFTGRELAQVRATEPVGVRRELYEPGQVILREGEVGRELHLVWSGDVEVVRALPDGGEELLATLGPGDHFGEVAVFNGTRRTATVRAVTRVELVTLGREETLSLASAVRPLGDALRRRLSEPADLRHTEPRADEPRAADEQTGAPMASLPPPLDELTAEQQSLLATYLEPVSFPAGTTIFRGGEDGNSCFLLDEGEVRLEVAHPELDTEGVLGYLQAGELLGELSLLDRQPRSATALAETDVRARELTQSALDGLMVDHPDVAARLIGAFGRDAARKLRASNVMVAEHLFADTPDPEVDEMVARARSAQQVIDGWDESRIDALLSDLAQAVAVQAEELARRTVEETHVGNVEDKTLKNTFASLGILQSLIGRPGRGPLGETDDRGVMEIAVPAGVIFGIIPMTNPVATAIFKTLIALKARNALILSFHRSCLGVGTATGETIRQVLVEHGAPEDLVQWIRTRVDRKKTARFMAHPDVSLVLATGGPGMVRAAYSSGTPAIGVGSGNAPAWVSSTADVAAAAEAIVSSKSFDNGLICGSEHNIIVDARIRDALVDSLELAGAAVLDAAEAERFLQVALSEDGRSFRLEVIGQSASVIAGYVGVERDHPIKLIVVPAAFDLGTALAGEKMTPVLSLFSATDDDEALALALALLGKQGRGHTAIVHATDPAQIERFAALMPASRIIANAGGAQGVCGISTGLDPSFTLGCGTVGGNSTSDNVTYRHLQNIKRLAHGAAVEPAADLSVSESAPAAG